MKSYDEKQADGITLYTPLRPQSPATRSTRTGAVPSALGSESSGQSSRRSAGALRGRSRRSSPPPASQDRCAHAQLFTQLGDFFVEVAIAVGVEPEANVKCAGKPHVFGFQFPAEALTVIANADDLKLCH